MRVTEIAEVVYQARPELTYEAAYKRGALCVVRMQRDGLVRNVGGVWGLIKV